MRKWFSELRVAHKLMLMSVFFLLPDSIMLYLMLSGINDNIQFAQQEIRGNQYLPPLVHLLHLLPEHQRLARSLAAGDATASAELGSLRRQINQNLLTLQAVDRRYATTLQFTDEALKDRGNPEAKTPFLVDDWNALISASDQLNPELTAGMYQHLLQNVRDMITYVGDMSNLILDPDLDTYYLMDAALLSIPQDQDQLARAIDSGEAALRTARSSPDPTAAPDASAPPSAMYAIMLQADLDHVVKSIRTALREDSSFYGTSASLQHRMPPALEAYIHEMTAFIQLTKSLDQPHGRGALTAEGYRLAGTSARQAGLALWEISSQELDQLLQMRIGYYQRHQMLGLTITAFAVLAASLLVTLINRSINLPLQRAAAKLRELNAALNAEVNEKLKAQSELIEASHRSGMAEIATGVLHNVGNVLNSVNTSATVIREKLDRSRIPTLSRAAAMIEQHKADAASFLANDPRGRQLPELLSVLAQTMASDQNLICDEIGQLARNIEHIRQIVQAQQSFAKGPSQVEEFDLAEMIEDALRMTGLTRSAQGIELTRNLHPCDHAFIGRHKVLQIMVNLISNAKKAVMENAKPQKEISVSLESVADAQGSRARILVADNGVGISAENLEKIFQHGFTTRKDGHGFGLHTAILDAHEMGGSITVCSSGPGAGATFMLEIPLSQAQAPIAG